MDGGDQEFAATVLAPAGRPWRAASARGPPVAGSLHARVTRERAFAATDRGGNCDHSCPHEKADGDEGHCPWREDADARGRSELRSSDDRHDEEPCVHEERPPGLGVADVGYPVVEAEEADDL